MTRLDWAEIRERVDTRALLVAHLGTPERHKGGKPLWLCPFHDDHSPSMEYDSERDRWKCWACGEGGDAAAFLMKKTGATFPEVVEMLAGELPTPTARVIPRAVEALRRRKPKKPPADDGEVPKERLDLEAATALVAEAEARLWAPGGETALIYLRRRGLRDETIRAARLGLVDGPARVPWKPTGITIPWFEWGRLVYLNVRGSPRWLRRFDGRPKNKKPPKYLCGYREGAVLYPSVASVRPFRPLVVVEGEFEAILLGQEIGDLASVVTTGAASEVPGPRLMRYLQISPRWFLAMDADAAGEKLAVGDPTKGSKRDWPSSARRVKPPAPAKDWTEHAQAGGDLRAFWEPILRSED